MKEVLEDFFKTARERYASAVRIAFLIVGVLLALHITTIAHYIQREQAVRKTTVEKEKTSQLEEVTKRMAASANNLEQQSQSGTKSLTDKFINELIEDFKALNLSIRSAGERDESGQIQHQQPRESIQQIQGQIVMQEPRDIIIPDELVKKLQMTQDTDQLRKEFAPWIASYIVTPRLSELREGWKTNVWPDLDRSVLTLRTEISQADELLSKDSTLKIRLSQLSAQLADLLKKGDSVEFHVPENATWWQTIGGKMTTGLAIGEDTARELGISVVGESARTSEEIAIAAKEKAILILAEQESARNALERGFEEQKKRAEDLAKPLTFLALDLALVAESFPLILGVGLGVAFFWVGWRRRELLSIWEALVALAPEWRRVSEPLGFANKESLALIFSLVAALVWIFVASWQLASSGIISAPRAQELGTEGAIIVVVTVAWRFYENHRTAKAGMAKSKG